MYALTSGVSYRARVRANPLLSLSRMQFHTSRKPNCSALIVTSYSRSVRYFKLSPSVGITSSVSSAGGTSMALIAESGTFLLRKKRGGSFI